MKKLMIMVLAVWAGVCGMAQEIGPLSLDGKIVGEYLTMEMVFSVKGLKANVPLDVLNGDLALLEEQLPKGVTPRSRGEQLQAKLQGWLLAEGDQRRCTLALCPESAF